MNVNNGAEHTIIIKSRAHSMNYTMKTLYKRMYVIMTSLMPVKLNKIWYNMLFNKIW